MIEGERREGRKKDKRKHGNDKKMARIKFRKRVDYWKSTE